MTKSVIRAFSTGEISPELASSTELVRARQGMVKCENMIVVARGGVKNRPGTEYIADCYDATEQSRLIPFQFNKEQAYVLEFGDLKMRIIKDGGLVGGPTEVVSPYPIADVALLNGDASSADTLYVFHPDYEIRKITRTSDTAWTISENIDFNGPYKARVPGDEDTRIKITYVSGIRWEFTASTAIFGDVEVGEPITLGFPVVGDIAALRWVWFIVKVVTSDTVIRADIRGDEPVIYNAVSNPVFQKGIEFWEERSDSGSSLLFESTNQTALLTDGAGGNAKMQQSVLVAPNVNHILKVSVSSLTGTTPRVSVSVGTTSLGTDILPAQLITSVSDNYYNVLPTADVIYISFDTLGSTDADEIEIDEVTLEQTYYKIGDPTELQTTDWRLSAWNSTYGYPEKGIIKDGRLHCAGNFAEPDTIWVSKLNNYEDFAFNTPSLATDGFSFLPQTQQINGVYWLIEQNGLNAGSAGGIWKIFASSGGVITPTDVNIKIDSSVGSLDLRPITAGNSIIMTPRGMSGVTELTSSNEAQGYIPRDLTVYARHLFEDRRIVRWAYAQSPDSVIWGILDNGQLLGLTYLQNYGEEGIWAWHKHSTPLGEGFKDIAIIPNSSDDNVDDVYFVINRAEIGETPNYYIEKLNKRITSQTAAFGLSASGTPYDYRFLDSALTYDDPKTITAADFLGATLSSFATPSTNINGLTFDGTNLISCDIFTDLIYIHNGVTSSISSSFAAPFTGVTGLAFDGTNLISGDFGADLIYIHNGITSSVSSSFATPATHVTGLTFDGTNLISCDVDTNLIYIHDGITSSISSSFAAPATGISGLAFDGTNLISCNGTTDLVYVHDGVTSTILKSFTAPANNITAITYDDTNIISCDVVTDLIYIHDEAITITSTAHGYSDGDFIKIQNAIGMTELNDNLYKVANKTVDTYQLYDSDDNAINGIGFKAYISNGESREMVSTVSGLDHLEGETVAALADGWVETGLTVASGEITLADTASFVHIGLPYTSEIETVDIEIMFEGGNTQGRMKSVTKADVYFKNTRGAEISVTSNPLIIRAISFDDEATGEDPPDLLTGSKEITLSGNYRKNERIKIKQTDPLPIHIKRIIPDVDYGG